jgi:hypothetical protein
MRLVLAGIVAASVLVSLFVPRFYAVVQGIRERVKRAPAAAGEAEAGRSLEAFAGGEKLTGVLEHTLLVRSCVG